MRAHYMDDALSAMFTCGILKSLNKFATCIDVALDAAPKTPEIFFCLIDGFVPSGHL
jgi:hypothetical protein